MLGHIRIDNFKVARNLELPLAPLTLLAGLNGSGKSTVLQIIATIRQSYLAGQGNSLHLRGPMVSLGQGIDVLSEGAKEETIVLAVTENQTEYRWVCQVSHDANQLSFIESPKNTPRFIKSTLFQYLQADRIVPQTLYPQADQSSRQLGFLGSHGEFTADFLARDGEQLVPEKRCFRNDCPYLDGILLSKIAPTRQLKDQVAGWLQHISPGARLRSELLKGTDEVMLNYQYIGQSQGLDSGFYRPTHVGFGLTYSLPILVACLAASKDSLLLIENPEAHLHPQGQARMGELLARCAADGVQILLETHSDHVLNGIRLAVKRDLLDAKDTNLCYFTRDIATGECYVEFPALLPNGQLSNWPEGFFDQWEKSLDDLLDW